MQLKKGLFLTSFVTATLFVISIIPACKKSSSSPSTSMTATIMGANFQATTTTGIDQKAFNLMTITGTYYVKGADTALMVLQFPDTVVNHEVLDSANGSYASLNYYPQVVNGAGGFYNADANIGNDITLTITSYDTTGHKISGTFSATAYGLGGAPLDSVVVTKGQFNSSYILQ